MQKHDKSDDQDNKAHGTYSCPVILAFYPGLLPGDGILFSIDLFVFLFIYCFVCLSARLRENGWTDMHEIFREGVDCMQRPDYILGQFRETARRRNTGPGLLCFAPQLATCCNCEERCVLCVKVLQIRRRQ